MKEDQASITAWAVETFGRPTPLRCALRTNTEMAELLNTIYMSSALPEVADELADVQIMLYQLASSLRVNLASTVEVKMITNRNRKWAKDGHGCGQHE